MLVTLALVAGTAQAGDKLGKVTLSKDNVIVMDQQFSDEAVA